MHTVRNVSLFNLLTTKATTIDQYDCLAKNVAIKAGCLDIIRWSSLLLFLIVATAYERLLFPRGSTHGSVQ
jgi:hypothetical protein